MDKQLELEKRLEYLESIVCTLFAEVFPSGLREVTATGKDDREVFPTWKQQQDASKS